MSPTSRDRRSSASAPRLRSRGGTIPGRGAWDVAPLLIAMLLGCGGSPAPAPASAPASPPPPRPASGERKVDDDIDTLSKKAEAALAKSARLSPAPALAGSETYVPRKLLSIPVDSPRLSGRKRAELWVTSDAGQTWVNQGEVEVARSPASHLVPRDGRYGIVWVPLSSAGVREFTPKPGDPSDRTFVVDTVAPLVEVQAPNGGETFGGGRQTVIRWMAEDVNLHPEGITLEVSTDSGASWTTLRRGLPNTGSYPWDVPSLSTTHARIRVRARDLAGNEGTGASERDFTIDARTPEFRITGPSTAREVPVRVEWTAAEDTAGLKRLTLYVSRDRGQTWAPYPEEIGLKSPILFKDLDGVYGLILVGESRVGNQTSVPLPGTPPSFTLRLDRTKPEVKLHSPQGGGVFAGVPVEVRWTAKDNLDLPPNSVALYYSADDGGTWTEVKRGLVNEGAFKWIPPQTAGKDSRLKVVATDFAGNEGFAVSERFGVDISVPEARAIGPDRSNSHSVNVVYEIRNRGSAPLRKVTLYYRPEHVKEWIKYGDDPDQESPVLFAKADGKYGIYVVCATEAGLASDRRQMPPEEGTEPQLWLTIDATPPQLTLESFNSGGYVMAGAVMDVAWKMLEANPDPKGMEIQHSPDGGITWTVVATGVDPTRGSHRWIVPNSAGGRHKIRLLCTDRFGNRGQVESEKPFTIDNDLPVVVIRDHPPSVIRSSRLSVKFKASDPTSGIDHVALLAKKWGDAAPYKELARTPQPEGTLECEMPGEGAWACLVVAVDGAGHASAEPDPQTKPDFVTTFDVTKPVVAIRYGSPQAGMRSCLNGNWEVEWEAKDNLTPKERIQIRIDRSSDGGKTWTQALAAHPNTGKADLRAHLIAGKKWRLRVVAIDEAGNEGEDVSQDIDPGDVPLPALALRGVDDGRQYVAGSSVAVAWSTQDKGIREASLELSKDGGRSWSNYADMHTGSMRILMPEKAGRFHLRAMARDSAGRPVSSNILQFDTIEGVEPVRIVANPSVESGKLMMLIVEPKSIVKTAKELRLELSEDGVQWRKIDDVRTTERRFLAPAVPGEYHLRLAVKAPDGREYDSNHVKFKVTGKDPVGLRLENFRGGEVFAGDRSRVIAVKAAVSLSEVAVEFSSAGGREGTWKEVPRELLEPVSGGLLWKRLPAITSRTCRLRLAYRDATGTMLKDESEKDFSVDSTKPVARVVGPVVEAEIPVKLEVQIDESISPAKGATLYVWKGGAWELQGRYDLPGPVAFAPREAGDYGVFVVVRSEAGLAGDPPLAGTKPQATIRARGKGVPAAPPSAAGPLAWSKAMHDVLKGGTTQELSWSAAGDGRVRLVLVADGKTMTVKEDLPATGTWAWAVPKEELKNCRLVLEMGEAKVPSRAFSVRSHPPEIKAAEIEIPGK